MRNIRYLRILIFKDNFKGKSISDSNFMKGNLSVSENSKPLNNPLVSTKIAYEARFPRYYNFLKNSVRKKETKE